MRFSLDFYLNSRVFLVEKLLDDSCPAKICCSWTKYLLVLKTSNFQRATIRPIVPRQTLNCLYCSPLNFHACACSKIKWIIFNFLRWNHESKMWNLKKKTDEPPQYNLDCLFYTNPLVYRKLFTDNYYPSGYFLHTGTISCYSSPLNFIRFLLA